MRALTRRSFLKGLGATAAVLGIPSFGKPGRAEEPFEPNTWYHVFVDPSEIEPKGVFLREDKGNVELITFGEKKIHATFRFGRSPDGRLNYSQRIGSVLTDLRGEIVPFRQVGDIFTWKKE